MRPSPITSSVLVLCALGLLMCKPAPEPAERPPEGIVNLSELWKLNVGDWWLFAQYAAPPEPTPTPSVEPTPTPTPEPTDTPDPTATPTVPEAVGYLYVEVSDVVPPEGLEATRPVTLYTGPTPENVTWAATWYLVPGDDNFTFAGFDDASGASGRFIPLPSLCQGDMRPGDQVATEFSHDGLTTWLSTYVDYDRSFSGYYGAFPWTARFLFLSSAASPLPMEGDWRFYDGAPVKYLRPDGERFEIIDYQSVPPE